MYDESIDVVNAREVPTPSSSDDSEGPTRGMAGKFNPPARHLAGTGGAFDSDSDSHSDPERFVEKNVKAPESRAAIKRMLSKPTPEIKREVSTEEKRKTAERNKPVDSSENSDSDSNDYEGGEGALRVGAGGGSGSRRTGGVVVPAAGAYDPKKFADLKVSPELENLFQHILRYTPQKIDIEFKLQPFVPDYVPAVGDIDAFIKVSTPRRAPTASSAPVSDALVDKIDQFGLTVLDEPGAEQSDSALLHLQLRAVSKTSSAGAAVVTKKIENAEKNTKAIDRWIKDVSELHLSKPAPTVSYTVKMPDLDTLMEEWPETMEETLNNVGFPPYSLDCSLVEYVDLVCTLLDVPVVENTLNARIQALHMVFTLYIAVKNSQLYADRQKEEKSEAE